jgi:preprotein translocase subunit SecE
LAAAGRRELNERRRQNMAMNIAQFFREVKQEGQKVTWPSRKETLTTAVVVSIMVAILSVFLLFTDWVVSTAIEYILSLGG